MRSFRRTLHLVFLSAMLCGCTAAPTVTVTPSVPTETPSLVQVPDLAGLDFDSFVDQSYRRLLLRDPDNIVRLGLSESLEMEEVQLTNASEAYARETQELQAGILEMLRQYDREALTPEQQLTYDVYEWYLDDEVRGHAFCYSDYVVSQFLIHYPSNLVYFFTDIHPLSDLQDARDYVTRLSQVGMVLDQVLESLELREDAGYVLPSFILSQVVNDLRYLAYSQPVSTPFYSTLVEKFGPLDGVSPADMEELLGEAEREIGDTVLPAFMTMLDFLKDQQERATDEVGAWRFHNGEAYYAQVLRHHTTTDLTADQIHELGLQEVERIRTEIQAISDQLGYPEGADLQTIYGRAGRDGGQVAGSQVLEAYEAIIDNVEQRLPEVFHRLPDGKIEVLASPNGNFYEAAARDGSRPAAFYASFGAGQYHYRMPTLAYHETMPGHHLQIALSQEMDAPLFRSTVEFTGHVEGWALYAEKLAWEMGLYQDDPYGDLGRLQQELTRAVRMVVDTGIHAKKWTFNQGVDYFVEHTAFSYQTAQFEVARYVVWPGQAVAYKVGELKILELRQRAMDASGEGFDLREFHDLVLGHGSLPLEILERIVDAFIEAQEASD